ncbi:hypothetical protein [Cytobacillus oceanisediminis]|uniref:hypothetical protein n=1 Tax=Cytobacillus oceanisediminis TaxID=665099 RepID=UPI001C248A06|nr:hypothetical protein [Cytobacillus oceanisediminis]MBU8769289.1 hypothetical protein [Cytobacillus oceanisediminis]
MKKIYVVGGQQKNKVTKDWQQYNCGVILQIDIDQQELIKRTDYISPPEVSPDYEPSIVFKAGTVKNKKLYVCTETEILIYSLPNMVQIGYLSLPCFNDVHHILPTYNDNFLIANTGLDMVMEIDPRGDILNTWNVLMQPPWERFSPSYDYRKVPTTKPHHSHPNYVFTIGKDIWATRCLQKDAICLTKPNQKINIGGDYVHDGVLRGDTLYFTRVDGHVVTVDVHTLNIKNEYNLNHFSNHSQRIGWCRGIKVLDDETVIVGFTRIRPSKNPLGNEQLYNQLDTFLPTRIACYNLVQGKLLWEHNLEKYNFNAVFSIHMEDE